MESQININSNLSSASLDDSSSILVFGASGLIGSSFLKQAMESAFQRTIYLIVRHELPASITKCKNKSDNVTVKIIIENDTTKWGAIIQDLEHIDTVFYSIGATKSSRVKQSVIDLDLTITLLTACKQHGVQNCFIVTTFNNFLLSTTSSYFRLKRKVELQVLKLGFNKTIFLRPGPLVGDRSVLDKNISLTQHLSDRIAFLTYNTPVSMFVGYSIKVEQISTAALFLIETNASSLECVKYITSYEMFSLSQGLLNTKPHIE